MNKNEKKKSDHTRNDINSRINKFRSQNNPYSMNFDKNIDSMENFEKINEEMNKNPDLDIINNVSKKNQNSDYFDYNSNIVEKTDNHRFDKKGFKNQMNDRMCNLTNVEVNFDQEPINHSIRNFNIQIEPKKEEFNDKMFNYSLLGNTKPSQTLNENKIFNMGFQSRFTDDINKRLEQLSPLQRNTTIPIHKPDNQQDFGQSVEKKYNSNNYQKNQIENIRLNNDINKNIDLRYERHIPVDTKQHFNFKNFNPDN